MSEPQSPKRSLNLFKDEVLGSLREMENNLKTKFSELESSVKTDLENFKTKINLLTADNNEYKELMVPLKLKLDKISELEKFKNKVDDMLITHEVRIKNNFEEIRKFQLRYDQLISQNLYVPGYIGNSCQFKTLAEYLSYNINEVSKIKMDREQMKKDFKDLKTKQDNMIISMTTLNESAIKISKSYADGKNNEIKEILKSSLKELNQKSFEMRTMIHQFAENAKKIEDKGKEELEKIIEIRNSINDEIKNNILETKKFREDINKKIKENNNEMGISKRKIENLLEQIKEMNKNISNINMKMKNTSNTSNIMNNRNKINISSSVSPMKERKFKTLFDNEKSNKNSPLRTDIKMNISKSRNKSEISDLDSIITENSAVDNNQKQTKDMQVNTDNNDIIELKEVGKNRNNIKDNIINNAEKVKMTSESGNMTNTNSFNILSIQNSKNGIKNSKNNIINTTTNNNKNNLLPSILRKKEIDGSNLFSEESKKINDNNSLSPRLKKNEKYSLDPYNPNNLLKIKSTKIVFHSDDNPSIEEDITRNNKLRKSTIDRNILFNNYNISNKNINNVNENTIQPKKVKFNHRKEILIKRASDPYKSKEKEKKGLKLVSLDLPKTENDLNKKKDIKEELTSTIDNYRANAFSNIKNTNENNINQNEEMLDFPRKVTQAFGRTTYNFVSKNDVINHINANNNINNFELANNKTKNDNKI